MAANLTQILNFKASFHQEFELFSKNKIHANNHTMVDTLTLVRSIICYCSAAVNQLSGKIFFEL